MLQERRLFCGRLCEVGYHRRDRALFSLVVRGLVRGLVSANHVRGRLVELATIAAIGVCRAAYTYTHIIYMHIHSKIFHTHKHNTHTHTHTHTTHTHNTHTHNTHTHTHTHKHTHTRTRTHISIYIYRCIYLLFIHTCRSAPCTTSCEGSRLQPHCRPNTLYVCMFSLVSCDWFSWAPGCSRTVG